MRQKGYETEDRRTMGQKSYETEEKTTLYRVRVSP